MAPSIMWFRRDLRLGDHPALHEAVRRGGADGVVPLFVVDEAFLGPSGSTRVEYLIGCLDALSKKMGTPIVLRVGDPAIVVPGVATEVGASSVVVTGDCAPKGIARDSRVEEALDALGVEFTAVSTPYVVAPGTVRSEKDAPLKVFTAFRRRWELIGPHVVLPEPEVAWVSVEPDADYSTMRALQGSKRPALFGDLPDEPTPLVVPVGEDAALDRLAAFVDDDVDFYRERRDLMSIEGTSMLSAALRFGCIHPRTILAATQGGSEGRTTFRSEIAWREFYADVLFHNPSSVRDVLQPQMAYLEWDEGNEAEAQFRSWARGETGVPLVDAGMRQLLAQGWMHNRSRMITASFLVKHLHLDWRWGARWFMWRLVDGDVASNQHGWQWTAGTGTDAAPFHRIFSPIAQAERFDADAAYIHRWIPELGSIDPPAVFQPGGGTSLLTPADYPAPMVDLKAERAEALDRFARARDAARAAQQ